MSRDRNAEQNINIKRDNESFEAVTQFKCLRTTLTSQNSIHDEIKSRLSRGMLAIIQCSLLSKNVNIMMYRTTMSPVLYGCETWSLALSEECWLRAFENRVLRRIFKHKRHEVRGSGEGCKTRSFILCTSLQLSFEWSNQDWDAQYGVDDRCKQGFDG
jgi:hypothetical protein